MVEEIETEIDWDNLTATSVKKPKKVKKPYVMEKDENCKRCKLFKEPLDSFYCYRCYYFPGDNPIAKCDRRNFHTRETDFWEKKARKQRA